MTLAVVVSAAPLIATWPPEGDRPLVAAGVGNRRRGARLHYRIIGRGRHGRGRGRGGRRGWRGLHAGVGGDPLRHLLPIRGQVAGSVRQVVVHPGVPAPGHRASRFAGGGGSLHRLQHLVGVGIGVLAIGGGAILTDHDRHLAVRAGNRLRGADRGCQGLVYRRLAWSNPKPSRSSAGPR